MNGWALTAVFAVVGQLLLRSWAAHVARPFTANGCANETNNPRIIAPDSDCYAPEPITEWPTDKPMFIPAEMMNK